MKLTDDQIQPAYLDGQTRDLMTQTSTCQAAPTHSSCVSCVFWSFDQQERRARRLNGRMAPRGTGQIPATPIRTLTLSRSTTLEQAAQAQRSFSTTAARHLIPY